MVTITEPFIDKYTGRQYKKGEEVEFSEERANELQKLKLCTIHRTLYKSGEKKEPKTKKDTSK